MKVILQKDVPNLGDAGEIKEVSDGYARNYLLPRRLVIAAHAGSTRALEHHNRIVALKATKRNAEMQKVAGELQKVQTLDVPAKVGKNKKLFGSVTTAQIAALLAEKGFQLDRRKIEIGDKIRTTGNYPIKIRLAEKIVVPLTLNVFADSVVEEDDEPAPRADAEKDAGKEDAEGEGEASDSEAAG